MADDTQPSDPDTLNPVVAELWFPRGPAINVRVRRVSGRERLSGPYEFEVDFSLDAGTRDLEQLLGAECELVLDRSGLSRHVYGIVSRVEFALEADADARAGDEGARVAVAPAFALLDHDLDTRFFSGMSVIDILAKLLIPGLREYRRELDVVSHIVREYPRRDYCVQFRESTLAFCERIMQEEGIGYFFIADIEGERERIVLFDNNDDCSHVELLVPEPIPIVRDRPEARDRESLQQLDWLARGIPNRVLARAYNLKNPARIEEAAAQTEAKVMREVVLEGERRHIIDDPIDDPDASSFDGVDLEQCQRAASLGFERFGVEAGTGRGRGNAIGFRPGAVFDLGEGAQDPRYSSAFLLTSVDHEILGDDGEDARGFRYENRFLCIPHTQPFRPPRSRPRPSVQGVLTGLVVGPEADEVHTDTLGRVRVRFHTDRHSKAHESSTCWVRVAQVWAGQGYGAMVIPRVGMEVVVAFVDGNPDCPIVTGCVYNGAQQPPYSLPGELTKTTFKSSSSPAGDGFNELRLEDAKGAEQIFVHGQRRMDVRVRGPLFETTGGNREEVVGGGAGEDAHGDHNTLVHGDVNHHVMGSSYVNVDGAQYTCVGGGVTEEIKNDRVVAVGELSRLSARNIELETAELISLRANDFAARASAGITMLGHRRIAFESDDTVEIKVGESFISLTPHGISISGDIVRINSGGAAKDISRLEISAEPRPMYDAWDALPADDGKPGRKRGGGRGAARGGGRERTPRGLEPDHRAPPPSDEHHRRKDAEDHTDALIHGEGTLNSLEWLDVEAWCGESPRLVIEAEHASPGARAGLRIRDAMDGSSLLEGIGYDVRDSTQSVEIYDILPRTVGGGKLEKDRLLHANSLGRRTPAPLRFRFLSDLPASVHSIHHQPWRLSVSDHVVKFSGTISYVRAWMHSIINLSGHVPSATPGRIEATFRGTTNWWYAKEISNENWRFWNGADWLEVPKLWENPHGVNRTGIAVWREPHGTIATQVGRLPWPDPLPTEQRPDAEVREVIKKWERDIRTMWSRKHQIVRVECGSPFEPGCCRLDVDFDVEFVEKQFLNEHAIVVADNFARANSHAWPLDESSTTAAHEFGHLMGNPDEYIGATRIDRTLNEDHAVNGIDEASLMGSGNIVRLRHYNPVCHVLSKAVAQQLGKHWTFKPAVKP
ncbi:type VI secretion system Vgr family protein [Enhygromyxa salina]|uniref:Phage-related baseplate assembly protein n=1 Tax=Enhygromyxa salina TaxID=215803 RepID=A0A2S9YNF9_9BACT|nr:type VI secretion system tip protein TssI/VgrG [Enhygromyxa salina]PRQ06630.1 Phage-related baseplate assembly protein [Enhygromyxa salina]